MANENVLIDFWRYSSMKEFLNNRFKFLHLYVLKDWNFQATPSMLVGSAGHKALETILEGGTVEEGVQAGLKLIDDTDDKNVKWGETGSREEIVKRFTSAIGWFIAEMPKMHKILAIEEPITAFITVDGHKMAMPANGTPDCVEETADGEIDIHDWKFVRAYTDSEKEKADRILQALFYYHLVWAKFGKAPRRMIYHECKTSLNKSGEPQVQKWILEFDKFPQYIAIFAYLYDTCTLELMKPDVTFLPNIADMLSGDESFALFVSETMGIERPMAVQHKTKEDELVERKYVPSATNRVENEFLTEEEKIRLKLQEFGRAVQMEKTYVGHNVIKYTLKAPRAARMSEFPKYEKDIALALKAESVRIEAPIMGTDLIGIEVPNPNRTFVHYKAPIRDKGGLPVPIGVDVFGNTVEKDLADMPHLLVAGATGSGKSVFLNVLIRALMDANTPDSLKFVMIDPKRVELSQYKGSEFLEADPIYEVEQAKITLQWLVDEMENRYEQLENSGAKNIKEFRGQGYSMHNIVVIIDELADLMITTRVKKDKTEPNMTELAIVRIAQKARAVGIHLVIGTQRPSVDVVTGLIKANVPTRIAFATAQKVDSQIILDQAGAETLIGKGDLLFLDPSRRDLVRLQSFYVE